MINGGLEPDNGGICIGSSSFWTDQIDSYTSCFMTNTIEDSTYSFYYGGMNCWINYVFISPVTYDLEAPNKKVSKGNSVYDGINEILAVSRQEEFSFDVYQYVPNTYNTAKFDLASILTQTPTENVLLEKLQITDQINPNLVITRVYVLSDKTDVSHKFNISISGNTVIATMKYTELDQEDSYNCNFDLKIYCRLKDDLDYNYVTLMNNKMVIENKAHSYIQMGEDNISDQDTNSVYVQIKPKVTNSIDKFGTDIVYRADDVLDYTVNYSTRIYDYVGDVYLRFTDYFPYDVDTLDGAGFDFYKYTSRIYGYDVNLGYVDTISTSENYIDLYFSLNYSVKYSNMNENAESFSNYIQGKTFLLDSDVQSNWVSDTHVTTKGKNPITTNEIVKTGTDVIYSSKQEVEYSVYYKTRIENYAGNVSVHLVDNFPYDIEKIEANGFDFVITDSRTAEYTKEIGYVDTNQAQEKYVDVSFTINYKVLYANMGQSDKNFTNYVYGCDDLIDAQDLYTPSWVQGYKTTIKYTPTSNNEIVKTGTDIVHDTKEEVEYSVYYKTRIENYVGNVNVHLIDNFPYEIERLEGEGFNFTITDAHTAEYVKPIGYIDTNQSPENYVDISFTINYKIVYADMPEMDGQFINYIHGADDLIDADESYIQNWVEGSKATTRYFGMNIEIRKVWNDSQTNGKATRPKNMELRLALLRNSEWLDLVTPVIDPSKDEEIFTFKNLMKYDENNVEYEYTVVEGTVKEDGNFYEIHGLEGDKVSSRSDLSFYCGYSVTKEVYFNQNNKEIQRYNVTNEYTSISLKGNVWNDTEIDGIKKEEDGFKGVEVQLLIEFTDPDSGEKIYEYSGYNVRTDENGDFEFTDLPWNGTYKVRFLYNGQVFESTYYKKDLSGTYSNAREYSDIRKDLNDKFATINASPNNYGENKRAFNLNHKIKNTQTGNYIDNDGAPYTFEDVLNDFNNVDLSIKEYNDDFWGSLNTYLKNKTKDPTVSQQLVDYLRDSIIYADTPEVYSVSDLAQLNPGSNNVIQLVTYGIAKRQPNDLSIVSDIYKVTSVINGRVSEDIYNTKENKFEVDDRVEDSFYNGEDGYTQSVKKSDFIYNALDLGLDDTGNLHFYVTYKLKIVNNGAVSAKINSISDFYDKKYFETIEENPDSKFLREYTFIGDENFNELSHIKMLANDDATSEFVFSESDASSVNEKYNRLDLTSTSDSGIKVYHSATNTTDDILHPNEEADVYLTLKVKNEGGTNRVPLEKLISNIAEINSYTTLYTPEDNTIIPDKLDDNNGKINKTINEVANAGLVDIDSNPGSLDYFDFDENNHLIIKKELGSIEVNNIEDDNDIICFKAKLSDEEDRQIGGFVFEDDRTRYDESTKALTGNGYYDENDTPVNGVTVELVQLIPNLDADGVQLDGYLGEMPLKVHKYEKDADGNYVLSEQESIDYYSGSGKSCVLIEGMEDLGIVPQDLDVGNGQYRFDCVYPGEFYVRFTYGDSYRTVLMDSESARIKAESIGQVDINDNPVSVNQLIGENGLNEKSYNGQDYKSTIYQSAFGDTDGCGSGTSYFVLDQSGSYNGIEGYTRYEGEDAQNYEFGVDVNNKRSMYYYNMYDANDAYINGDRVRLSDAKDMYCDRKTGIEYSKLLVNKTSEILDSFERICSDVSGTTEEQREQQIDKLNTFMLNTKMRANSGIMKIDGEHNNEYTTEIDFGLVERPKAQVSLSDEITNLKVVLENGMVLFDTNKSVNNLYFGRHGMHSTILSSLKGILGVRINNAENTELIQGYIDDELLGDTKLVINHRITAKNVGEVDFNDQTFYYTGIELDPENNIATTKVNKIISYVSNSEAFDREDQSEPDLWGTVKDIQENLFNNGYLAEKIKDNANTYNSIVMTEKDTSRLLPEIYNESMSREDSIDLILKSEIDRIYGSGEHVYNNTCEIIETENSVGRRCYYSIPGNQTIADQTLGNDADEGVYTKETRVIPEEIDSDSAQRIVFMPPTGEKNYTNIIAISLFSFAIIIFSVVLIKIKIDKNNEKQQTKGDA